MRGNNVTVFEFNPKGRVGQRLGNDALHLNGFFFRQGTYFSLLLKGWRIVQKRRGYCNAPGRHSANKSEHNTGSPGQSEKDTAGSQADFSMLSNVSRAMFLAPRLIK